MYCWESLLGDFDAWSTYALVIGILAALHGIRNCDWNTIYIVVFIPMHDKIVNKERPCVQRNK